MSARIPTSRTGRSALAALSSPTTFWKHFPLPLTPRRNFSLRNHFIRRPKANPDLSNEVLASVLKRREETPVARKRPEPEPAKLLDDVTIFNPDYEIPGFQEHITEEERERFRTESEAERELLQKGREATLAAPKLDPDPKGRRLWERKMVIRGIRRRGRLSKGLQLARTERQSLFKSQDLPTSVKKLTKVMNQIQGKTVEEALVQLRFSKKKVSRDVVKGLQLARDEAIVARGMGLGSAPDPSKESIAIGSGTAVNTEDGQSDAAGDKLAPPILADGTHRRSQTGRPTTIELRDGKRKRVHDPTEIYVDQAWVGKGEAWKSLEFRARGRTNVLRHRTTSFSVLLKEENTRIRISNEIQQKRANRKLWVALPDRPVTAQRQYCLW